MYLDSGRVMGEPPNLVNRDISSPMRGSFHQVNELFGQARSPISLYLVIYDSKHPRNDVLLKRVWCRADLYESNK